MIRYVKIKRPDTEEIREMLARFCEETGAEPGQCEILQGKLASMHVFGAINGTLQAVGGYYRLGEKAVFDFIYVKPEYRNKSIAGRLHRMGVEHVKQSGLKSIVLFTRPETAKRYEKIGYSQKFAVLEREV